MFISVAARKMRMAISLRLAAINFIGPSADGSVFFDFLAMGAGLLAKVPLKAKPQRAELSNDSALLHTCKMPLFLTL